VLTDGLTLISSDDDVDDELASSMLDASSEVAASVVAASEVARDVSLLEHVCLLEGNLTFVAK
jgi:hypothetical protein